MPSLVRILIVEDDRLVLAGLAGGLEERGYRVTKAGTGEEALSLADSVRPDLVLLDVGLPGISGIETAQRIQEKLSVPVVFLSAMDADALVRRAISLGTLNYLVKPVTIKQLVPAIETAFARARDINGLRSSEENLAAALRQSREISVAIGVLMERHELSAEDAFELLRTEARNTRVKTGVVARGVISGAIQLQPPPPAAAPKK